MKRLIARTGLIGVSFVAVAPAVAGQCPKLIGQINQEAGNRMDGAAVTAREKAAQADKLHKEGKHADSEKVAKEALAALGKKM